MIENPAKKLIDKYLNTLNKDGLKTTSPIKREYNFEAEINSGKESIKLLVFFGKKGIKTILQGNKETELYRKINSFLFGENLFEVKDVTEPDSYIGIDESG
ncbi:MAG TPA: hypothetical protein VLN45_07150, partial [Ignavibacteriaceae bacterium]|nr:hypothetical protein [Ignavibacteriaceae bacterium]